MDRVSGAAFSVQAFAHAAVAEAARAPPELHFFAPAYTIAQGRRETARILPRMKIFP